MPNHTAAQTAALEKKKKKRKGRTRTHTHTLSRPKRIVSVAVALLVEASPLVNALNHGVVWPLLGDNCLLLVFKMMGFGQCGGSS